MEVRQIDKSNFISSFLSFFFFFKDIRSTCSTYVHILKKNIHIAIEGNITFQNMPPRRTKLRSIRP